VYINQYHFKQFTHQHIPVDEKHPDCLFVEDTVIIIDDIAVLANMGASSRQGEELMVKEALEKINFPKIVRLPSTAKFDGGDILFTGKEILVGISSRTNIETVKELAKLFPVYEVIGINVLEGLHLKSVLTAFDDKTIVIADTNFGKFAKKEISEKAKTKYNFVVVPDPAASNILRIGNTIVIQEGFPKSEAILTELAKQHNVNVEKLMLSEMIKGDGCLTCGSVLFRCKNKS